MLVYQKVLFAFLSIYVEKEGETTTLLGWGKWGFQSWMIWIDLGKMEI